MAASWRGGALELRLPLDRAVGATVADRTASGTTRTYLPASSALQGDPSHRPDERRGTNWRPSSDGLSVAPGLGLGPQVLEPYG